MCKKASKMSFGSRLAPGSPPGAILERFSSLRGAISERFWKDFRALGKLSSELSGLCVGPPSATFFPDTHAREEAQAQAQARAQAQSASAKRKRKAQTQGQEPRTAGSKAARPQGLKGPAGCAEHLNKRVSQTRHRSGSLLRQVKICQVPKQFGDLS